MGHLMQGSDTPMGNSSPKCWLTFEEVATDLLHNFAEHFNLGKVEGKCVVCRESGSDWELDARGWSKDGKSFVVVECKRYLKRRVTQSAVGALAWVIQDVGASGGILVSPHGLQSGAKLVAENAQIIEVTLTPDSTTTDYVLAFLKMIFVGRGEAVKMEDDFGWTYVDENGLPVDIDGRPLV